MGTIALVKKCVNGSSYEMGTITLLMKWVMGYEIDGSCYEMGKIAFIMKWIRWLLL